MCLYLNRMIPNFTPVNLSLELVRGDSHPIECSAKVVWCIKSQGGVQDNPRFDTGVEFLDMKSDDRERIRTFIQGRL